VGLDAHPRTTPRNGSVADVILDVADEADAEAIVLGSRGLTGVRSLLLGSISHAVLQHADRPVVVVPSPAVTEARAPSRSSLSPHLSRCGRRRRSCEIVASWPLTPS
jgi:hypothetical protein